MTAPDATKTKELMESLDALAKSGAPLWPNEALSTWVTEKTGIPVAAEFEGFDE